MKAFFPNEEISQNLDEKQESLVSVKLEENSCFYVPVSEIADCPDRQDGKKVSTKEYYTKNKRNCKNGFLLDSEKKLFSTLVFHNSRLLLYSLGSVPVYCLNT